MVNPEFGWWQELILTKDNLKYRIKKNEDDKKAGRGKKWSEDEFNKAQLSAKEQVLELETLRNPMPTEDEKRSDEEYMDVASIAERQGFLLKSPFLCTIQFQARR